ncbi:MAG: hypothetical protein FRX48_05826 [Lasallia pustulata]|uniref:SAP domain-containing protein n=1 Tax=Lasallia pustulata TaxID=136370 RepID=A0A5M8PLQ8_9LECA|nr:MAG: hypothetical protein FRX48_05826 [Lasallia pustulata]
MASLHSSSVRAVQRFAGTASKHNVRRLHMTGANSTPSQLLSRDNASKLSSRSLKDLRDECERKNVSANGSKAELVVRLTSSDISQSRSFSSIIAEGSKRPSPDNGPVGAQPVRHFNTTRSLKVPNDTSFIDFAYMPQYELTPPAESDIVRIPLLPDNSFPARQSAPYQEGIEPVTRPEISTVSGASTHIASPSAMSEVTDNHSIELDPFELVHKVQAAAAKMSGLPAEELKEPGVMKKLWDGLLDDLLGARKMQKA